MDALPQAPQDGEVRVSRTGVWLLGAGATTLLLAGLLLWWREGSRLFTDGLIAAIVSCF